MAGLYDLERGPHSYWLKVGVVKLGVVKNDGHENPWLKTLGIFFGRFLFKGCSRCWFLAWLVGSWNPYQVDVNLNGGG